jgi:hypothetical protein
LIAINLPDNLNIQKYRISDENLSTLEIEKFSFQIDRKFGNLRRLFLRFFDAIYRLICDNEMTGGQDCQLFLDKIYQN